MKTVFLRHFERALVCTVKFFGFAFVSAVPDGSNSVDNMFCTEVKTGRDDRITGLASSELKAGSLKLATKAKVPIVPVTISGTYHFFEETGAITWGVHVDVIIHEPIDTANLSRAELAELPEKVEDTIRNGLESLK